MTIGKRVFSSFRNSLIGFTLALLFAPGASIAGTFVADDFKIVMTPDHYPIIWKPSQSYGVDLTVTAAELPSLQLCNAANNCDQAAIDAGAVYFKVYEVNGITVTVYYDANGNIVGTSDNAAEIAALQPPSPPGDDAIYKYGYAYIPGGTRGRFNVAANGSANFVIPIKTAPGFKSVQPSLALAYNSNAGNGMVGMGWNLSGLSAITRCGKNMEDDGEIRAVRYDAEDLFCLDGQRLNLESGSYGANGSTYRTRQESWKRIKVTATLTNGPASFEVTTKDGKTLYYGTTQDSRIEAQGRTDNLVRVWALNKVVDENTNVKEIEYTEDAANGQFYPLAIRYGKNETSQTPHTGEVHFTYGDRADTTPVYQVGSIIKTTKRLKSIAINNLDDQGQMQNIRNYHLSYKHIGEAFRSFLSSVTECDYLNTCFEPVIVDWETQEKGWQNSDIDPYTAKTHLSQDLVKDSGRRYVDVNGDGLPDLVYALRAYGVPDDKGVYLNKGNGLGFETTLADPKYNIPDVIAEVGHRDIGRRFVDLDGDGDQDFIFKYYEQEGVIEQGAYLNTGNGWIEAPKYMTEDFPILANIDETLGDLGRYFIDVNGDGLLDMVFDWWHDPTKPAAQDRNKGVLLNLGRDLGWDTKLAPGHILNFPTYVAAIGNGDTGRRVIDIDGDGLQDLIMYNGVNSEKGAWRNTGNGWISVPGYIPPIPLADGSADSGTRLVDINGDGLVDLVRNKENVASSAYLNTGAGWKYAEQYIPPSPIAIESVPDSGRRFVDVNADGLVDLLYARKKLDGSVEKGVYLNRGSSYGWDSLPTDVYEPPTHIVDDAITAPNPLQSIFSAITTVVFKTTGIGRQLTDLNNDGQVDLVWKRKINDTTYEWSGAVLNKARKINLIGIRYGDSAPTALTVDYTPMTHNTVYAKGTGASYPKLDVISPQSLVSSYAVDNGLGDMNSTTYKYGGMKSHTTARTSLGFAWMESLNTASGHKERTTFNQTYNGTEGTPSHIVKTVNGIKVEEMTNTWVAQPITAYTANSRSAQLQSSTKKNFDLGTAQLVTRVVTDYVYDGKGNPTSITKTFNDGYVHTTTSSYVYTDIETGLPEQTITTVMQPGGTTLSQTSTYSYHTGSRRLKDEVMDILTPDNFVTTAADGKTGSLTKSYLYDDFGNVIEETISGSDIVTRSTTTAYDASGRYKTSLTNALVHSESYSGFDMVSGQVLQMSGPNGGVSQWTYDSFGRKVYEKRVDGTESHIDYSTCAAASGFTCPTGTTWFARVQTTGEPTAVEFYDRLGRKLGTASQGFAASWVYQEIEYNALGQVARQSQPHFATDPIKWSEVSYDALGRAVSTVITDGSNPLFPAATKAYSGLTLIETNPKGQATIKLHNSQGKVISVTDAVGSVNSYEYDPLGNLTRVIDAANNVTLMQYDNRGRKIAMDDPDMGQWSYDYNVLGELASQTDAKQVTVSMAYDLLGRMVQRSEPEGVTTWSYDTAAYGKGKLAQVTSPGYSKAYLYDDKGRVASETITIGSDSYTTGITYDAHSRTKTVTYPGTGLYASGFKVEYLYDGLGFLDKVVDAANQAEFWRADYVDAQGTVMNETLGNGHFTSRTKDNLGLIDSIQTYDAGSAAMVQDLAFDFDDIGNLMSRSDRTDAANVLDEVFTYDDLNRLKTVTGPEALSLDYDAIGNITYKSDVGSYEYTGYGVHAVSATSGVHNNSYSYDANGNMLSGAGRSLSYTSFNKPLSIVAADGTLSQFGYDADHNRLTKTVGSKVVSYIGGLMEKTVTATKVEVQHFIKVNGSTVAIRVEEDSVFKHDLYLHKDHLGSTDTITDQTGAVVERYSFDAFGKRRLPASWTAGTVTPLLDTLRAGFTGHEMDDESGLINMGARMYDPVLGRFLQADTVVAYPYSSQGFNRYSYTDNNPLSRVDPSGHAWDPISLVFEVLVTIFQAVGHAMAAIGHFVAGTVELIESGIDIARGLWDMYQQIAQLPGELQNSIVNNTLNALTGGEYGRAVNEINTAIETLMRPFRDISSTKTAEFQNTYSSGMKKVSANGSQDIYFHNKSEYRWFKKRINGNLVTKVDKYWVNWESIEGAGDLIDDTLKDTFKKFGFRRLYLDVQLEYQGYGEFELYEEWRVTTHYIVENGIGRQIGPESWDLTNRTAWVPNNNVVYKVLTGNVRSCPLNCRVFRGEW